MLISPSAVKEGSTVTLTCSSSSNPAVTRYAFFRGGKEIQSDGTDTYTFEAEKALSPDYKCSATNSLGTEESAVQKLDVQCKIIIIVF